MFRSGASRRVSIGLACASAAVACVLLICGGAAFGRRLGGASQDRPTSRHGYNKRHARTNELARLTLTAVAANVSNLTTQTQTQTPEFFAPDSIWNEPVSANAPLDPRSAAIVANLAQMASTETLGLGAFGGPTPYIAASNTPLVKVTLTANDPLLQEAFDAVPIPANAQPSTSTDETLLVYQPSSNTMWEFWKTVKGTNGWTARWGGRMMNVSTDPGYYRNVDDPEGDPLEMNNWGTTATSFPLIGGTMMIKELEAGVIQHALALAITFTCAGVFAAPAQRTDGSASGSNCVPEGAHFRLNPDLNLASLHLPHFIYMMAVAAQKYGIYIDNRSHGFTFKDEDATQFIEQNGYDPYFGRDGEPGSPGALYTQWPNVMLEDFPWSQLQLLQMDLRTQPDPTVYIENP